MTHNEAEQIACQLETMIMGVEIRPDSMTINPDIIVAIEYNNGNPTKYVISDKQGTHVVDARSLTCSGKIED